MFVDELRNPASPFMTSSAPDVIPDRLDVLLLARLQMYAKPPKGAALADNLYRYAPGTVAKASWRELVLHALEGLQARQVLTSAMKLAAKDALQRRIGPYTVKKWDHWADRILPGLALGILAEDTKAHTRLSRANGWTAAIAARSLGLWTDGPPPTFVSVCDALVWRELGLDGVPQECPVKVRAHFLRKYVANIPGKPDRLVRLLATSAVESLNPELDTIRACLIRRWWLVGRELGASTARVPSPSATVCNVVDEPSASAALMTPAPLMVEDAAQTGSHEPDAPAKRSLLVEDVRRVAQEARDGVFGDRKVFISTIWDTLHALPRWLALDRDHFKSKLVEAHRRRELVLARADLVAAMDPELVAASETRADGATFHFVVREPVR
ncbi:MAG: hypothetical protein ABIY55_31095 [Kofleriaceae bacterium]